MKVGSGMLTSRRFRRHRHIPRLGGSLLVGWEGIPTQGLKHFSVTRIVCAVPGLNQRNPDSGIPIT